MLSFQYDGDQGSQVTSFAHTMAVDTDNIPLAFQLFASLTNEDSFDKRIKGVNLYWTKDASGFFEDPLWLGYWHWGSNEKDL